MRLPLKRLPAMASSNRLIGPSEQLPLSLVPDKQAQVVKLLSAVRERHGDDACYDCPISMKVDGHHFGFARATGLSFRQEGFAIVESTPVCTAEGELGCEDTVEPLTSRIIAVVFLDAHSDVKLLKLL
jgi:hypothetical protein